LLAFQLFFPKGYTEGMSDFSLAVRLPSSLQYFHSFNKISILSTTLPFSLSIFHVLYNVFTFAMLLPLFEPYIVPFLQCFLSLRNTFVPSTSKSLYVQFLGNGNEDGKSSHSLLSFRRIFTKLQCTVWGCYMEIEPREGKGCVN
jgi:hypothetical protein